MTTIKLDDIPDLVKSNKLSKQEACVQVYYTLYTNPARFGLLDMDEDYRSDFLLHFLQHKTNNLIQNYTSNRHLTLDPQLLIDNSQNHHIAFLHSSKIYQ